ncbi:MAG TPA: hypothetical protein VFQ22_07695 [Longimicrobiales bacterium]|nr:hypothetical protein [Longimicrobiales bacterium]
MTTYVVFRGPAPLDMLDADGWRGALEMARVMYGGPGLGVIEARQLDPCYVRTAHARAERADRAAAACHAGRA